MTDDSGPVQYNPADLGQDIEYAVLLPGPKQEWLRLRPLRAVWDGANLLVDNPDDPTGKPILKQAAVGVRILGRWNEKATRMGSTSVMTWQGVFKHAYGEVLRQRSLVRRLHEVGIEREPEPYILSQHSPNAIVRSMTLNYDELDLLLRKAGV